MAQTPRCSDLPHPKRKRTEKKRIPQWVLDEWKGFASTRPAEGKLQTPAAATASNAVVAAPGAEAVADIEPDLSVVGSDSAAGAVSTNGGPGALSPQGFDDSD